MHHRSASGRQVCFPAWGWQPMCLCPWLPMKTSPAISARQPTTTHREGESKVNSSSKKKKARPGRKQPPSKCVSLWKKRKESELSILVKDVQAFPKQPVIRGNRNRSRMGIRRYEYQFWFATNLLCDFGLISLFCFILFWTNVLNFTELWWALKEILFTDALDKKNKNQSLLLPLPERSWDRIRSPKSAEYQKYLGAIWKSKVGASLKSWGLGTKDMFWFSFPRLLGYSLLDKPLKITSSVFSDSQRR